MLFGKHQLSEHDNIQGMVLSPLQKQVIENRIAVLAMEIVNAEATLTDQKYFEKLNFTKGQMAELASMIASSDEIEQSLNTAKE